MSQYTLSGIGDEVLVGFAIFLALIYALYWLVAEMIPNPFRVDFDHGGQNEEFVHGLVRTSTHDCSICLGEVSLAVQTNCGHVYCGRCILQYYDMGSRGMFLKSLFTADIGKIILKVISDQIKIIFSKNDFKSDQDHI
jgi:hypothetical protein